MSNPINIKKCRKETLKTYVIIRWLSTNEHGFNMSKDYKKYIFSLLWDKKV